MFKWGYYCSVGIYERSISYVHLQQPHFLSNYCLVIDYSRDTLVINCLVIDYSRDTLVINVSVSHSALF